MRLQKKAPPVGWPMRLRDKKGAYKGQLYPSSLYADLFSKAPKKALGVGPFFVGAYKGQLSSSSPHRPTRNAFLGA